MFIQFITKETQDARDTGKELQIDTWVFFHLGSLAFSGVLEQLAEEAVLLASVEDTRASHTQRTSV